MSAPKLPQFHGTPHANDREKGCAAPGLRSSSGFPKAFRLLGQQQIPVAALHSLHAEGQRGNPPSCLSQHPKVEIQAPACSQHLLIRHLDGGFLVATFSFLLQHPEFPPHPHQQQNDHEGRREEHQDGQQSC